MGFKNVIVLQDIPFSTERVVIDENVTRIVSRYRVISCNVDPRYMVGMVIPPSDPKDEKTSLMPPEFTGRMIYLQPLSSRKVFHEDEINKLADKGITFEYK